MSPSTLWAKKLSTNLDKSLRNADQKTPYDLFYENNEKIRSEAKDWMCENAKNCSVIAVLIATVAFTSAYTIPGGLNDSGHPILLRKPMFIVFALADAISLSAAMTSVILFLMVVTSPFRFKDFASSLFEKQLLAMILLIVSVTMMMVAFAATLILTIQNQAGWTHMTLYCVSFFPVAVFLYTYMPYYLQTIQDGCAGLKKLLGKAYVSFRKIWEYRPASPKPVRGTIHNLSRSPV